MRNLSTLIGLGGLLSTTVTAFSLQDNLGLGLEARHHKLLARAAPKCSNGFARTPDKTSCYCPSGKYTSLSGAKCLKTCSSGSYIQPGNPVCQPCPEESWLRCSSANVATACKDGFFLSSGTCVERCPTGTWEDGAPGKNRCRACADPDAVTCSSSKQGATTACLTKYLFEGLCIDAEDIPDGYYPNSDRHVADRCAEGVATCSGGEDNQATSCKSGRFLTDDGKCEASCPSGSYGHKELNACLTCDSSEKTCDADGAIECAKTPEGTQLYLTPNRHCILPNKGQSGYYPDDATNSFKECDEGVAECIGTGPGNALACGKLDDDTPLFWTLASSSSPGGTASRHRKRGDSTPIAGTCVEATECPAGTWADPVTSSCVACDEGEATCRGNGSGSAITCKENLFLTIDDACVTTEKCKASGAFFPDETTSACSTCDAGEASCDGNGRGLANSCAKNDNGEQLFLYERDCVVATDCPGNYYPDETELACKPCDPFVLQCKGPGKALACGVNSNTTQLYLNDGQCILKENCPSSTYADPRQRDCASCTFIDPDAATCTSPFTLSCKSLFYQDISCVPAQECRNGTYGREADHVCASCSDFGTDVKTCDKDGALSCKAGNLEDRACRPGCKTENYAEDNVCHPCLDKFDFATSCESESATGCDGEHFLKNGICVDDCGDGFYDDGERSCQPCATPFPNSATCTKIKPTSCASDYVLSGLSCESDCLDGQYPVDGVCADCPGVFSATCDRDGVTSSCSFNAYIVRGSSPLECVETCEGLSGRFDDGDGGCQLCSEVIENANECSSYNKATSCQSPYVLHDNKCELQSCPLGTVNQDGICVACDSLFQYAASCDLDGAKSCKGETVLNKGSCGWSCDEGSFNKAGVCTTCPQAHATKCTEIQAQECEQPFRLHNGGCVEACEGASYESSDALSCIDCPRNVAACNATTVQSCISPYVLLNNTCNNSTCPSGYRDADRVCITCGDHAASCTASEIISCVPGRVLYAGKCDYAQCPSNFWYNDNGVCKACSDANAKTCAKDGDKDKSLTCQAPNRKVLEETGRCRTEWGCPTEPANGLLATYESGNVCKKCEIGEYRCTAAGATYCYNPDGVQYFKKGDKCVLAAECAAAENWLSTSNQGGGAVLWRVQVLPLRQGLPRRGMQEPALGTLSKRSSPPSLSFLRDTRFSSFPRFHLALRSAFSVPVFLVVHRSSPQLPLSSIAIMALPQRFAMHRLPFFLPVQ